MTYHIHVFEDLSNICKQCARTLSLSLSLSLSLAFIKEEDCKVAKLYRNVSLIKNS
jgi:hypothetical protein